MMGPFNNDKKISISYGKLIIEVISVILAILLALAVDNCKSNRENQALAAKALNWIDAEISRNLKKIKKLVITHEKMLGNLSSKLKLIEKSEGMDGADLDMNLNIELITKTAWNTAMVTQALRHIEFKTVQKLSPLYELQDFYHSQRKDLITSIKEITSIDKQDKKEFLVKFRSVLNNLKIVVMMEKNLSNAYSAYLKR